DRCGSATSLRARSTHRRGERRLLSHRDGLAAFPLPFRTAARRHDPCRADCRPTRHPRNRIEAHGARPGEPGVKCACMSEHPLKLLSSMATRELLAALADDYRRAGGRGVATEAAGGVDVAKRIE